MASFTDIIPQFNPYVQQLPVAMVQVGMEKQRRYDEGVQKIQSYIDNIAGLDVIHDADKAYLQSKLNELGNKLKTVAAGDFSNFQLVNSEVSYVLPQCGLSLPVSGLLAGTDSSGVFLFSDNGDSLGSRNDGLTNLNIHSLTIDNNDYVYAGTDNGVWRTPLSEIASVEEELIDEVPTEFLLSQNYPNPFNPSTSIQYAVSNRQFVSLKVYDILGNEIETLVNEEKQTGTYEVIWFAEQLPSGVYFYQLRAGNFIEAKKMLLLK